MKNKVTKSNGTKAAEKKVITKKRKISPKKQMLDKHIRKKKQHVGGAPDIFSAVAGIAGMGGMAGSGAPDPYAKVIGDYTCIKTQLFKDVSSLFKDMMLNS